MEAKTNGTKRESEPVGIVGERGSVSWRSERILPVGTSLYAAPQPRIDLAQFKEAVKCWLKHNTELASEVMRCGFTRDVANVYECKAEEAKRLLTLIAEQTMGSGPNSQEYDPHLIAAAPELLEALIGVVRVADRATAEFDAARAAIARVQGGQ